MAFWKNFAAAVNKDTDSLMASKAYQGVRAGVVVTGRITGAVVEQAAIKACVPVVVAWRETESLRMVAADGLSSLAAKATELAEPPAAEEQSIQ